MSIEVIDGNIFTSKCQVVVNTINCVGVMGAGIALEYRLRYPEMYSKYVELCDEKKIDIGLLWVFKKGDKWILNFPTKKHWKYPSKEEYLHAGLEKFISTYSDRGIKSIAFPLLGADKGGISSDVSLKIMRSHLEKVESDISIEIYKYNPKAKDELYERAKKIFLKESVDLISKEAKLSKNCILKIRDAMNSPGVVQLNQLVKINGVGTKTLEKIFKFSIEFGYGDGDPGRQECLL